MTIYSSKEKKLVVGHGKNSFVLFAAVGITNPVHFVN